MPLSFLSPLDPIVNVVYAGSIAEEVSNVYRTCSTQVLATLTKGHGVCHSAVNRKSEVVYDHFSWRLLLQVWGDKPDVSRVPLAENDFGEAGGTSRDGNVRIGLRPLELKHFQSLSQHRDWCTTHQA